MLKEDIEIGPSYSHQLSPMYTTMVMDRFPAANALRVVARHCPVIRQMYDTLTDVHMPLYIHVYTFIYREREREREGGRKEERVNERMN